MIGNLKPIKLLKYSQTIDANGDATESVATTYKMWAEVEDGGGSRSEGDGRTEMSISLLTLMLVASSLLRYRL